MQSEVKQNKSLKRYAEKQQQILMCCLHEQISGKKHPHVLPRTCCTYGRALTY